MKRFEDLKQARAWLQAFVSWYNGQHRHSGIQFVTPAQRHAGADKEILRKRREVYEAAKVIVVKQQQAGALEVKANAQLGAQQRSVAEPAARAS